MSDVSDLKGVFPTALRWNAEGGVLGRGIYDEATGGRSIAVIEFGGREARFVMDMATRERGYGLIRTGVYDMRLSPIGSPAPEWPGEDYKPAIGCWMWNPTLDELRLETVQSTLLRAVTGVWDRCRSFKEAAAGLQPVIHFADRVEQHYRTIGKSFWMPVIHIIGWVERDKIPPFAGRAPTVKPPLAIDAQISFALLEDRKDNRKPSRKRGAAAKSNTLEDFLDDEIPDLAPPQRKS